MEEQIEDIKTRIKKHGDTWLQYAPCACAGRPRCEWIGCDNYAEASILQLAWPTQPERFKWSCAWHFDQYDMFVNRKRYGRRIPGLDKPPGAGDDWRPNLIDMINLCAMEVRRQERAKRAEHKEHSPSAEWPEIQRTRSLPPLQRVSLERLRRASREIAERGPR